jgi:reactive intermediate/imine deaminase
MSTPTSPAAIVCANSDEISPPAGHYSHVCVAGGFVHVSGQLPVSASGVPLADRSFSEQAQQVLANVEGCLRAAGVGKADLVQVRVYITDVTRWPEFNRIYAEWMGSHRPARAVVGVSSLHFGVALEVEAVALAGQSREVR